MKSSPRRRGYTCLPSRRPTGGSARPHGAPQEACLGARTRGRLHGRKGNLFPGRFPCRRSEQDKQKSNGYQDTSAWNHETASHRVRMAAGAKPQSSALTRAGFRGERPAFGAEPGKRYPCPEKQRRAPVSNHSGHFWAACRMRRTSTRSLIR